MTQMFIRSPLARLRHDIRTPLNAIIGYGDVMLEELLPGAPPAHAASLRVVVATGHRLLASVTRTLEDVRQETGESLPDGLQLRLARGMSHDVGVIRAELGVLHQLGVAPDDLARIEAAVAHLWTYCTREDLVTPQDPQPAAPALLQAAASITGRVLIVDDLAENRDLLQRRLQLMGHQTVTAADGPTALRILDGEPVDLVLLDALMPDMDGLQVLRRVRADARFRHLPVIMLSAMDGDEHVIRSLEFGADDFVTKPFNPVFLRARVSASLEKKRLRDAEEQARLALDTERARVEDLLRVILPPQVVGELKATGSVRPRRYDAVAVLFCDVVDFTRWCDEREPEHVVATLRAFVERLEDICDRHGLQKIKTIGDSFMAVAGMLRPSDAPVLDCVRAGLEMVEASPEWRVRVGVHVGPVVAGVVGRTQYLFDLWGDTVNTAARVEAHGEPGAVCVSDAAWRGIADTCTGTPLSPIAVKGKGMMMRWRVDALRA